MSEGDATPPEGRAIKRACTECRQQKAKCDAHLNLDMPCSRCRKMNRQCIISEPFKREHKRKRISELEQEAGELHERLRVSHPPDSTTLPGTSWASINDLRVSNTDNDSRLSSVAPFSKQVAIAPVSFRSVSQAAAESLHTPESLHHDVGTLSRTLEGHSIDSKDIDALFQLYFRDYAVLLPILDPSMTPNRHYSLSSFLFWSIIGVSCRTYSKNPTLLSVLPIQIQTLALMSLNTPTVTLQIVQGILLLLHWPFPKSSSGTDLTYPLSSAVLHMAMQIGLHVPVASQEFSKQRVSYTEEELKVRAETWGYCTLIYQRTCWFKGNPATPMLDIPHDVVQRQELFQRISTHLKFELKLQDIVTRCGTAVAQNGVRTMSVEQERSLDTLLSLVQAQISSVGLDCPSELHHLQVQVAKMVVQGFTFFKAPTVQDPTALYNLSIVCCQVLESLEALGNARYICLSASSMYLVYSVMVASHILLRLLKTSFSRYIDYERAKSALFLGISLNKMMSVQNDDVPARNGRALEQLWNSTRVFRRANGSEAIDLRIRSRLTGSLVLDGIVWWREEFKGFMGVFPLPLGMSDGHEPDSMLTVITEEAPQSQLTAGPNTNSLAENTLTQATKPDYSTFMDDPMLSEFGWPVTDDLFSLWDDGHIPTI